MDPIRVAILVFDGVELLDFAGPYEVFIAARLDGPGAGPPAFKVWTVAEHDRLLVTSGGLGFRAACGLADCPPAHIVVVPGGPGARAEMGNPRLIEWLAQRVGEGAVVASVCTGAFLLGMAGLLDGEEAATHWAWAERLQRAFPAARVAPGRRVVDEGRVISSAGVSAGIDMALALVERYWGARVACDTARWIEYEPRPL